MSGIAFRWGSVIATAAVAAIACSLVAPIADAAEPAGTAGTSDARARATQRVDRFSKADIARVDRLLKQVQARLDAAPKSAEAKWSSMTRIEDSVGEELTLAAVRTRSRAVGVDPEVAVGFIRAQIEATKSIQAVRHRAWALDAKTAPARNVERGATDVAYPASSQPALIVGDAELRALRDALPVIRRAGSRRLLDARAADLIQVGGADLLASQIALEPLYAIAR